MGNPTVGGDGDHSYTKNSSYQRLATSVVKEKLEETIIEKFDVKKFVESSYSNKICIADFGCATGPNTIVAMQNLIDVIKQKYLSQCPNTQPPEFQIFFNDQTLNDFNTLFTSLPTDRQYFAAGVPGSFHYQLFPKSSLHLAYSSTALHWMSEVPEEVMELNKGRVHYTSAPEEVTQAYAGQFAKDIEKFLSVRAKELVSGGMVVIIMPGIPSGMPHRRLPNGLLFDLMASVLMEMVQSDLITKEQLHSFNLPLYAPSLEEMSMIITNNGHFTIEVLELTNPSPWLKGPIDVHIWMLHMKAAMEGMLLKCFDKTAIDELFCRLVNKLLEFSKELESCYRDKIQLFLILKCK